MTDSQELKPCPFCGEEIKLNNLSGGYECRKCNFYWKKGKYENAYCWKKIDEQAKLIDRYRETLKSTRLYIAQAQDAFKVSDDGMLADIDEALSSDKQEKI